MDVPISLGSRLSMCLLVILILGFALAIDVPPEPKYKIITPSKIITLRKKLFRLDERQNPWEYGELFESDIMVPEDDGDRNGLEDTTKRWPNATVVYYVDKDYFSLRQQLQIKEAIAEIESKSCVRFRPYRSGDRAFLRIRGNEDGGCASFMGRLSGGQEVNLEPPYCLEGHGTVLHELMHALGFAHQHSAPNRDKYIKIIWDNIVEGKKKNFEVHDKLTDFNIGYDYDSIMHYSAYAGSKNKKQTIKPLDEKAKIGQRNGLSKKDVAKLREMYGCVQKNNSSKTNGDMKNYRKSLKYYLKDKFKKAFYKL